MLDETIQLSRLKTLLGLIRTRLEAVWHEAIDPNVSLEINRPHFMARPAMRLPSFEIVEATEILEELDAKSAEGLESLSNNASASGVGIRHADGTVTPGPVLPHHFAADVSRLLQFIDVLLANVEGDLLKAGSTGPAGSVGLIDGANADNPRIPRKKKSTARGDAEAKIVAALTAHHEYENGGCHRFEPVGVNELARAAEVGNASANRFFNKQFGKGGKDGHPRYKRLCASRAELVLALKILNGELAPHYLLSPTTAQETISDEE